MRRVEPETGDKPHEAPGVSPGKSEWRLPRGADGVTIHGPLRCS